jgi:demethylmenaquinone methyltransferase/2-methoxy-6-polyprenyl-1,4-benzoquinol methylase
MRYYWDTVDQCVAPEVVMDALREAGFQNVARAVRLALLNEYTASVP